MIWLLIAVLGLMLAIAWISRPYLGAWRWVPVAAVIVMILMVLALLAIERIEAA